MVTASGGFDGEELVFDPERAGHR